MDDAVRLKLIKWRACYGYLCHLCTPRHPSRRLLVSIYKTKKNKQLPILKEKSTSHIISELCKSVLWLNLHVEICKTRRDSSVHGAQVAALRSTEGQEAFLCIVFGFYSLMTVLVSKHRR
jgi:hypothetical protein